MTTVVSLHHDGSGEAVQALRWGATSLVSFNTSTQSSAIDAHVVRLQATEDCYISISSNPTATTSDVPLSQGMPEYIHITPGHKIAAIKKTNAGILHITVCT